MSGKTISAIILAGGQSKRMGKDKAAVIFKGDTLLSHVVNSLKNYMGVSQIIISVNKKPTEELPFARYVFDEVPHLGPLGGILAGLKVSENDLNFVIACDMPFVNLNALGELLSNADAYDVVVPLSEKGVEPLFGIYKKSCISHIEKALEQDKRRVIDFYPQVRVLKMPVDMIKSSRPEKDFFSINTEDELKKAELLVGKNGSR